MPTYTYQCKKCETLVDVFHMMTEKPRVKCESCGSTRMTKMLGAGAGIIFKGSGFYETDYKSKSGPRGGSKDTSTKSDSSVKSESSGKSDSLSSKSESKAESSAAPDGKSAKANAS